MGYFDTIAFCSRCRRDVRFRCPCLRHPLHLKLTLLTLGFWAAPWLLFALLSGPCRCVGCGAVATGEVPGRPAADFAHPWREEDSTRIPWNRRIDFNTILVERGLVFYASTRPIRA